MSSKENVQLIADLVAAHSPSWPEIAQVVISLAVLILTGISVWCAFRAYQHQRDRAKKDAACKLARYYAHDIIQQYDLIDYVFKSSRTMDIIKEHFPLDQLKAFDKREMDRLLERAGEQKKEVLQRIFKLPVEMVYQGMIRSATSIEERHALAKEYTHVEKKEKGEIIVTFQNTQMLMLGFQAEINDLLNNSEWFSMTCQYGLADAEVLYQSLHQTFLSEVWMLYPYIALNNLNNEDKLFTNIISLFNLWKDRLQNIQRERQTKEDEVARKIRSKEKELEETKREAQDIDAKIYTGAQLK